MALNKAIQAFNGLTLSYWKVDFVNLNYDKHYAQIRVSGFVDRNNRESFDPTTSQIYSVGEEAFASIFEWSVLDAAGNNPVKASYDWLKTQEAFLGATDIIEVSELIGNEEQ